jgi:hypothetical protein
MESEQDNLKILSDELNIFLSFFKSDMKILVGVTGSVATTKIWNLVHDLKQEFQDCEIQIVATERSKHFFSASQVDVKVWGDEDEWKDYKVGDPVLHIQVINTYAAQKLGRCVCDCTFGCQHSGK